MRVSLLTFVAAISLAPLACLAADDTVPEFNIAGNCKTDQPYSKGTGETVNKCANDEQAAKQQLSQEWSKFSAGEKTTCIKETRIDGTPSYVELKVCLEMAYDTRTQLHKNP
jgi:hypothetical protein